MKKFLIVLFALAMVNLALWPTTKASADSLRIVTSNLPNAVIGQPYSTQIKVSGGTAPYSWLTISTTYPWGCCVLGLANIAYPIASNYASFNTQSSQTILDTAPAGIYSWLIQVTDATGVTTTKTLTLKIMGAGQITENSEMSGDHHNLGTEQDTDMHTGQFRFHFSRSRMRQ